MRARIITLANNFYQDEENKSEITDWKKELEEYCCLGYFDALGVQKIDGSSQEIRDCVHRISVERLKGNCSRRNVVCISSDVSKDDAFWERAHGQPCLFVSLIRVKRDMEKVQDLQEIINEINRKEDMIAYYTYDHSEVVVVKSDSGYLDGMKSVLSLYQYMDIFKMYSVFAVKEEELDLCRGIKEEEVDCLLSALVKDRTKVEGYIENLERFLGEAPGLSERFSITSVDTLGKCDLLVEICNVSLRRLLCAYKMGGLLTHTNLEYRKVFLILNRNCFPVWGGGVMEQWIIEYREKYKEIFKKYNDEEKAISSCAMSMAKILNGLSEMKDTTFHWYEKKMLWRPMEVFSWQCIEQLEVALECKDTVEKRGIISDIEKSISTIADVCRNILDGTANAERQTVQSLSLDIGMYDLSPKLCSFYSAILGRTIELFQENEKEYAFVMNPTLRSTIETEILLSKREKSGKVVVVHIPEGTIEQFDLVPVCLIHEAFHVITKCERQRKKRAKCLMVHMIEYMEKFLFMGVDESMDGETKKKLMNYWFQEGIKWLKEIESRTEDDRRFYGKQIQKEISKLITNCVIRSNENLEEVIAQIVFSKIKVKNYSEYHAELKEKEHIIARIRSNIFKIITENRVSAVADLLMIMYKETYADLACILTVGLTPNQYHDAFAKSVRFKYDEEKYYDASREIREVLVRRTVVKLLPEQKKEKWEKDLEEIPSAKFPQSPEKGGQTAEDYGIIPIYRQDAEIIEDYLFDCGKMLTDRLREMERIRLFRQEMEEILQIESDEDLLIGWILAGAAMI